MVRMKSGVQRSRARFCRGSMHNAVWLDADRKCFPRSIYSHKSATQRMLSSTVAQAPDTLDKPDVSQSASRGRQSVNVVSS